MTAPDLVRRMVRLDDFAVVGRGVIILTTALGMLAAWTLVPRLGSRGAEALALALVSASGFVLMAASAHFFVLFLGLEIGSISLYVLADYVRESPRSDEAAVKYFLLGSFASALFIYGVALAYAGTGALNFNEWRRRSTGRCLRSPTSLWPCSSGGSPSRSPPPLHSWAPDVYQEAPAEFVGFMAAVAKVGGFSGLMLILLDAFEPVEDVWQGAIAGVAECRCSWARSPPSSGRRQEILAYSGVAHAGFLLTGLVAGAEAVPNLWFYLVAYTMVLVAGFAVVAVVAATSGGDTSMRSLSGMSTRSPFLAAVLAVLLIALAGIPITSGFVASSASSPRRGVGFECLVLLGLVASVAAFFFYLRVIVVMYFTAPGPGGGARHRHRSPRGAGADPLAGGGGGNRHPGVGCDPRAAARASRRQRPLVHRPKGRMRTAFQTGTRKTPRLVAAGLALLVVTRNRPLRRRRPVPSAISSC